MNVRRAIKASVVIAGLASLLFGSEAFASTSLTVGEGWVPFSFGEVGSSFSTDFTFTGPAVFKVTDAFLDGDQFDISINGIDKGPTSTPVNDGTSVGDYDTAFASPDFSHASYLLGAGLYDVTGTVLQSPYGSGGAAAELVAISGVPEPATWAVMLIGFFGIGSAMRARRRYSVATA